MFLQISLSPPVKRGAIISYNMLTWYTRVASGVAERLKNDTAFLPMGRPECPHKRKKTT